MIVYKPALCPVFQSTLPRGERRSSPLYFCNLFSNFNPRSREGSDSSPLYFCNLFSNFNPRSREGSDLRDGNISRWQYDFNPRSREGSDDPAPILVVNPTIISIHAPARGATDTANQQHLLLPISIHAPARGATFSAMLSPPFFSHFNPRSREGSDCQCRCIVNQSSKFQSTLPRGERLGASPSKW